MRKKYLRGGWHKNKYNYRQNAIKYDEMHKNAVLT